MNFPNGSVAVVRWLNATTGEEQVLISYPEGWTLEQARKRLASDLDLADFEESMRQGRGRTFLDRLNKTEVRETIGFKRKTEN